MIYCAIFTFVCSMFWWYSPSLVVSHLLLLLRNIYFIIFNCSSVCHYVHVSKGVPQVQRHWVSLELELQTQMPVVGAGNWLVLCKSNMHAFNHWTIIPSGTPHDPSMLHWGCFQERGYLTGSYTTEENISPLVAISYLWVPSPSRQDILGSHLVLLVIWLKDSVLQHLTLSSGFWLLPLLSCSLSLGVSDV